MASSPGDDGGPLGLILAAVSNRAVIALLAVLTGSTVGTKLGRVDPFTGTQGKELERRITKAEYQIEAIRTTDVEHMSQEWHAGAGLRFQFLEEDIRRCLENKRRPEPR